MFPRPNKPPSVHFERENKGNAEDKTSNVVHTLRHDERPRRGAPSVLERSPLHLRSLSKAGEFHFERIAEVLADLHKGRKVIARVGRSMTEIRERRERDGRDGMRNPSRVAQTENEGIMSRGRQFSNLQLLQSPRSGEHGCSRRRSELPHPLYPPPTPVFLPCLSAVGVLRPEVAEQEPVAQKNAHARAPGTGQHTHTHRWGTAGLERSGAG